MDRLVRRKDVGDDPNPKDNPAQDSSSDSDGQAFSQDEIDALMSGGGDSEESADSAPAAQEAASDSVEINQADIDALMDASAGDGKTAESDSPAAAEAIEESTEPKLDTMGRPFDEAAAAMQAAMDEDKSAAASAPAPTPAPPPEGATPLELPDLGGIGSTQIDPKRVTMLNDVNLQVKIELGRTRMLVEEVLSLGEGSVVELDKLAGDPVDVYVNDRLVARGEVLVLNDSFCVRINDVLSHDPHRIIN